MELSSSLYLFPLFFFQFLSETRGNQIRVALFRDVYHKAQDLIHKLSPDQPCFQLDDGARKASSVRLLEGSCVLLCTKGCEHSRHEDEDCFILTSEVKHLQEYNDQLQAIKRCEAVANFKRFRYFRVEDELEDSSRDEREGPGAGPGQGRELREEKHSRSHNSYKVPIKHSDNNLSNFPRKRRHGKLDKYLYKYKH